MEVEVPPGMEVGSDEFRCHLEKRGLYFGLADVKDCFHRMRQPEWLSEYFCWDPIPVKWLPGLVGTIVSGEEVIGRRTSYSRCLLRYVWVSLGRFTLHRLPTRTS